MILTIDLDDDFNEDGFDKVALAAVCAIQSVMKAGHEQRKTAGKPTDEWQRLSPQERLHHAFMHLVSCKTHQQTGGDPCAALTNDTALTEASHALTGLAMVECLEGGYLDFATEVDFEIDTTEDEVKGE